MLLRTHHQMKAEVTFEAIWLLSLVLVRGTRYQMKVAAAVEAIEVRRLHHRLARWRSLDPIHTCQAFPDIGDL